MSVEAMKQALEAFEDFVDDPRAQEQINASIAALRQAIADAEKTVPSDYPNSHQQEPVAWMHTKIEGVVVPHRPADLDKHPDRWEALYKTPPPCPTCEALARTVMMDQTGAA